MRLKDILILTSIVTMAIMGVFFYIVGRYLIKPKNKKVKLIILVLIIIINISIVTTTFIIADINLIYKGLICGLVGSIIGFGGVVPLEESKAENK